MRAPTYTLGLLRGAAIEGGYRTRVGAKSFDSSCPDVGFDAFEGVAGAFLAIKKKVHETHLVFDR